MIHISSGRGDYRSHTGSEPVYRIVLSNGDSIPKNSLGLVNARDLSRARELYLGAVGEIHLSMESNGGNSTITFNYDQISEPHIREKISGLLKKANEE